MPLLWLVAAAPAVAQAGLSAAEWRRANVFFSNLAEAGMAPFQRGTLIDDARITFALAHVRINQSRHVERVPGRPGDERIVARHVEAASVRYFDTGIGRHRAPEGYTLAGRYSVFPSADGETYPFAHVTGWTETGGEIEARVTVYYAADIAFGVVDVDAYATPVAMIRRRGIAVEPWSEWRAVVRRVRSGGAERFVLLEWRLVIR